MASTKYVIHYAYGSYSGTHNVYLDDEDDSAPIDVMWAQMRREGLLTLPMATTSARIVEQEEIDDEE